MLGRLDPVWRRGLECRSNLSHDRSSFSLQGRNILGRETKKQWQP